MRKSRIDAYLAKLDVALNSAHLPQPKLDTIPADAPWHLLRDRERQIIDQRKRGETLRTIGETFRVSAERIRQIERRALSILHRRWWYTIRQEQYAQMEYNDDIL